MIHLSRFLVHPSIQPAIRWKFWGIFKLNEISTLSRLFGLRNNIFYNLKLKKQLPNPHPDQLPKSPKTTAPFSKREPQPTISAFQFFWSRPKSWDWELRCESDTLEALLSTLLIWSCAYHETNIISKHLRNISDTASLRINGNYTMRGPFSLHSENMD